jgi:hypothetical protein
MYHLSELLLTLKFFLVFHAMANIIRPEIMNRIPAKSILLPVICGVMPNSSKPNLIRGYAHPHAMAAVSAKITTHSGRWNMLFFLVSMSLNFRFAKINNNSHLW